MLEFIPHIVEYLKLSGQTEQELLSGADQYGSDFIIDELVPQAIKANKKIVWFKDPNDKSGMLLLLYRLESVS